MKDQKPNLLISKEKETMISAEFRVPINHLENQNNWVGRLMFTIRDVIAPVQKPKNPIGRILDEKVGCAIFIMCNTSHTTDYFEKCIPWKEYLLLFLK